MSVQSIIDDVEAEAKKLNPTTIIADLDAAKVKISEYESRIVQLETAINAFEPALKAVLIAMTPLLPAGAIIPQEVLALLDALPKGK